MRKRPKDLSQIVEDSKSLTSKGTEAIQDRNCIAELFPRKIHITNLKEGSYFGEVALITKLKRTASVISTTYSTLSSMSRQIFELADIEYPTITQRFKSAVKNYEDPEFQFRRKMLQNIPFLRKVPLTIIEDILYFLKPKRYTART